MTYISHLLQGFVALTDPSVFFYMVTGFGIGTFFGAVPGLTSLLAIALLLPLTYSLDVITALVMCASIFMSGMYAGSITATTINIPGAPSSMMTSIEGNALMKKGHGANALGHAALGSMVGGTVGALLLMGFTPVAAKLALLIQTPGKFSLILFALVVIIISDREAIAKGTASTLVGVMIATIGIDIMQPIARITFGTETLVEGIDMMPLVIGSFAISEIMCQLTKSDTGFGVLNSPGMPKINRKDFMPPWAEIKEIGVFTYFKSAIIGYFIGILPGAGGSVAAFVSYAEAKRNSKKPELFGKGSREGIAAAEAANNSMCGGAFVPMLMFGIPGDPTTAIVLGVLIINGLQPGPRLLQNQIQLIAPMFAALLISALILIPLVLYIFGPYFVKIVSIRKAILYSCIAVVALVGSYVATYSIFQMMLALGFGVFAFFLRKQSYPTVSMLLGYILGPGLEQYLRRSMFLSDNNPITFITSMDSLFFLVLTAVFFYFMVLKKSKDKTVPTEG